jgi:hypothetical protein
MFLDISGCYWMLPDASSGNFWKLLHASGNFWILPLIIKKLP